MDKFHGLPAVFRTHKPFLYEKTGQGNKEFHQSADGTLKGNGELIFPYLMEEPAYGGGIAASAFYPFGDEQPQDAEGTAGHGGVEAAALILLHEAEEVLHVVEAGLNGETAGIKTDGFLIAETYPGGEDGQEFAALIAVDDEDDLHLRAGFGLSAYRTCNAGAFSRSAPDHLQ